MRTRHIYSDCPLAQAPILVFEDADIESAVNGVAFASFVASGQTCVSGARILVHSSVYDDFMGHFVHKVESIRRCMGDRTSSTPLPYYISPDHVIISVESQILNGHRDIHAPP